MIQQLISLRVCHLQHHKQLYFTAVKPSKDTDAKTVLNIFSVQERQQPLHIDSWRNIDRTMTDVWKIICAALHTKVVSESCLALALRLCQYTWQLGSCHDHVTKSHQQLSLYKTLSSDAMVNIPKMLLLPARQCRQKQEICFNNLHAMEVNDTGW